MITTDHIFIFSKKQGAEADQLANFGWTEGSSRRHVGQGTINRKFYFDNFFLEILWVIEEEEIKNKNTALTTLWQRSQFLHNGYSPFGLCLVNNEASDDLFHECEAYQPDYFSQGMIIDVLPKGQTPYLPWTFRLPFRTDQKEKKESTIHLNGIQQLTKVTFGIPKIEKENTFMDCFAQSGTINFTAAPVLNLQLEFDQQRQGQVQFFEDLNLTVKY